jgi:hypothetical protein
MMPPTRARLPTLLFASAAAIAIACGDPYVHSNPYDPGFPVEIDVSGPDTIFSLGEVAQFGAHSTPAFSDTSISWLVDTVTLHRGGLADTIIGNTTFPNPGGGDTIVSGETVFRPSGPGTSVSTEPPLEPNTTTVSVVALIGKVDTTVAVTGGTIQTSVYRHTGFKRVIVTQRLTSIQLHCPDAHSCAAQPPGGSWSILVDGTDALGQPIYGLTISFAGPLRGPPIATYLSRDTTIASVVSVGTRSATVTARRTGATWIVAARGALRDSLQVVVQ